MKTYTLTILFTAFLTFPSVADKLAAKPDENTFSGSKTNVFMSRNWGGGMCRGGMHIISAPVLIPISLAYGFAVPFDNNPEVVQKERDYSRIIKIAFELPLTLAANGGVGAGGCALETMEGLFDVLTLGHYDLPKYCKPGKYDTRPYYVKLRDNKAKPEKKNTVAAVADRGKLTPPATVY
jgi:hypothetical protein